MSDSSSGQPYWPASAGQYGCPLLLSDIDPHREVAGEHARYVRPDAASFAAALAEMLDADKAQKPWRLSWTWNQHAEELLRFFHDVRHPAVSSS